MLRALRSVGGRVLPLGAEAAAITIEEGLPAFRAPRTWWTQMRDKEASMEAEREEWRVARETQESKMRSEAEAWEARMAEKESALEALASSHAADLARFCAASLRGIGRAGRASVVYGQDLDSPRFAGREE